MDTGVARRPVADIEAYAESLGGFVFRSGFVMKPIFTAAKASPRRVAYAEGEDERVLRAVQAVVEERIARPILIGRPAVIETRLKRFGLSIKAGRDYDVINPDDDPRYRGYVATLVELAGRKGITPDAARTLVRTNATVIGSLALMRGDADALLCGLEGRFRSNLRHITDIVGYGPGMYQPAALSLMITSRGPLFLADTHVRPDPTADEIAETTLACADHVRRFGITPKVALLSYSDFGSGDTESTVKMRKALALVRELAPDLEVDGEMAADTALSQLIRDRVNPGSNLKGEANLLILPNLDAANIAFHFVRVLADALPVGPILIGPFKPVHILTPSVTARGVTNMTAVAVVGAQSQVI